MTSPTLPSTDSTTLIFQTIRAHVLGYDQPNSGGAVRDDIDERFWLNAGAAPDLGGQYPHVVGRLINQQTKKESGRLRADLELYVFHRPRKLQADAELIADRIVGALLGYKEGGAGFLTIGNAARDTLAPVPPPGDRELVQVRIVADLIAYPDFIAAHSTL